MTKHSIAVAVLLILLPITAHTENEISLFDFCTDLSLIANKVMKARQQDQPMSEAILMIKKLVKNWSEKYGLDMDMDEAEKMAAEMVMTGYEEMISTDAFKKQKITEFENAVFRECYKESAPDS